MSIVSVHCEICGASHGIPSEEFESAGRSLDGVTRVAVTSLGTKHYYACTNPDHVFVPMQSRCLAQLYLRLAKEAGAK